MLPTLYTQMLSDKTSDYLWKTLSLYLNVTIIEPHDFKMPTNGFRLKGSQPLRYIYDNWVTNPRISFYSYFTV